MSYPFEPYKIKVLESIKILSRNELTEALRQADYNLFKVPSEKVAIDLLTDSGTAGLSQEQWSQMMLSDDAYASSKSWVRFEGSVKSFTGNCFIYFDISARKFGDEFQRSFWQYFVFIGITMFFKPQS